jgi:hypothetical protein
MQDTDTQELLLEILNTAEEGKSIEFQLITSWAEFKFYWQVKRSTKAVIRTLKDAAKNLFRSYCREIPTGSADLTQLLAYSQLQDVIAFYEKDVGTLQKMLDEYDEYLGTHFWYSFLGGERDIWNAP